MAQQKKILVFNNDNDFLDLMQQVLSEEGHDTSIYKTWQDAHKIIKDEEPQLVILDLLFDREARGFQIIDTLMLDSATRHIPLIVCSAATAALAEHQAALDALGIRILAKPFDIDQLLLEVRGVLPRTPQA